MVLNTSSSAGGSPLIYRSGLMRDHKRAQIRAEQPALFLFLHRGRDFFLEIEHHGGVFLVTLGGGTQRLIGKGLKPPQD